VDPHGLRLRFRPPLLAGILGREFMMPGVCCVTGPLPSPTLFTLWSVNRCSLSATPSMDARVT
jgi:hypothetical protein